MSDQASTTNPPEAAPAAGSLTTITPAAAVNTADVAALQARLAELERENGKLAKESQSTREARRREEEAKAQALAQNGEFKALAEERGKRLGELEGLAPLADKWRRFEEGETKRIAAIRDTLPAHQQAALDAVGDLDVKRTVLAAFETERAAAAAAALAASGKAAPPPKSAAPAAAPAANPATAGDIRSLPIDEQIAAIRDPARRADALAAYGVRPAKAQPTTSQWIGRRA